MAKNKQVFNKVLIFYFDINKLRKMDLIKQSIQQRISFLVNYRQKKAKENKSMILKQENLEFLKSSLSQLHQFKKKQQIRWMKDIPSLKILNSIKLVSTNQAKQFYQITKSLMLMYNCQFLNLCPEQKFDDSSNTINLYIQFFKEQECFSQSRQIANIYNKQLCHNNQLLPTLLIWFCQWSRDEILSTIKNQINHIKKQISTLQKSSIKFYQQKSKEQIIKETKSSHDLKYSPRQKQNNKSEQFHVNRQVLYGSFLNELNLIYKMHLNVIPDLDIHYLKCIRKTDLKHEITYNLKQIISLFIDSIYLEEKLTIQKYRQNYQSSNIKQIEKSQKKKLIPKNTFDTNDNKYIKKLTSKQIYNQMDKERKPSPRVLSYHENLNKSIEFKRNQITINSINKYRENSEATGRLNLLLSKRYVQYNLPHLQLIHRETKQTRFNQMQNKNLKQREALKHKYFSKNEEQIQMNNEINKSPRSDHHRYISLSNKQKFNKYNIELKKDDQPYSNVRITQILKLLQKSIPPTKPDSFILPKLN